MSSIVPAQETGKHNDLYYTEHCSDREKAVKCFARAYKRLLNPRVWQKLCGSLSADFKLVEKEGDDPHRLAREGDYYRIDIPGPGPTLGDGYDWVVVDAIEEQLSPDGEEEEAGMRLRPCKNPESHKNDIAHFFKDYATSTFYLVRKSNTVTASYHGRNEEPNTDTSSKLDNVRNAVVTSGAMAGMSEVQWMTLIRELLQAEIGG